MKNKPYTFIPEPEHLNQFSNLSARLKLEWLQEANQFVNDFVSNDKKKKWAKFKEQTRGCLLL